MDNRTIEQKEHAIDVLKEAIVATTGEMAMCQRFANMFMDRRFVRSGELEEADNSDLCEYLLKCKAQCEKRIFKLTKRAAKLDKSIRVERRNA